jgi:hypothetical protein
MRSIALAVVLAVSSPAHSQAVFNLPNFEGLSSIGRVAAFGSPRGVTWFLPSAFSSSLTCTPQTAGANMRTCSLVVYNWLTQEERDDLVQLQKKYGGSLTHFTGIESFVQRIDELFVSLPNSLTNTPFMLRNLQLGGEKMPYASITQRVTSDQAKLLLSGYQGDGIGEFSSKVTFRGERTEAYVALRNPTVLGSTLRNLVSVEANKVSSVTRSAMKPEFILSEGVAKDVAVALAEYFVRKQCFSVKASGDYFADRSADECLPGFVTTVDETSEPAVFVCTATLELKQNGTVKVACGVTP